MICGEYFSAIKKDQFKEMKNDHLEQEPFVVCMDCGRKQHQICVLHHDSIWPQGFCCDNCLKKKAAKRKENKFSAKKLPTSKLGIYIETRVNNFLKKKEAGAGEVHIRVVASSDKVRVVQDVHIQHSYILLILSSYVSLLTDFCIIVMKLSHISSILLL